MLKLISDSAKYNGISVKQQIEKQQGNYKMFYYGEGKEELIITIDRLNKLLNFYEQEG